MIVWQPHLSCGVCTNNLGKAASRICKVSARWLCDRLTKVQHSIKTDGRNCRTFLLQPISLGCKDIVRSSRVSSGVPNTQSGQNHTVSLELERESDAQQRVAPVRIRAASVRFAVDLRQLHGLCTGTSGLRAAALWSFRGNCKTYMTAVPGWQHKKFYTNSWKSCKKILRQPFGTKRVLPKNVRKQVYGSRNCDLK